MTIKGIVKNGIITPVEKVDLKEDQEVLIVTEDTEPTKENIAEKIRAKYEEYLADKPVTWMDEEERAKKIQKEMQKSSQYLEEKWKDQNINKIHTSEDIDANSF